jgi:hypothetical protein
MKEKLNNWLAPLRSMSQRAAKARAHYGNAEILAELHCSGKFIFVHFNQLTMNFRVTRSISPSDVGTGMEI